MILFFEILELACEWYTLQTLNCIIRAVEPWSVHSENSSILFLSSPLPVHLSHTFPSVCRCIFLGVNNLGTKAAGYDSYFPCGVRSMMEINVSRDPRHYTVGCVDGRGGGARVCRIEGKFFISRTSPVPITVQRSRQATCTCVPCAGWVGGQC